MGPSGEEMRRGACARWWERRGGSVDDGIPGGVLGGALVSTGAWKAGVGLWVVSCLLDVGEDRGEGEYTVGGGLVLRSLSSPASTSLSSCFCTFARRPRSIARSIRILMRACSTRCFWMRAVSLDAAISLMRFFREMHFWW